jgi:DNA-nicking Smr family endonuclease
MATKRRPPSLDPPRLRRHRRALSAEESHLWAHVLKGAKPLPGKAVPVLDPEPAPTPPMPSAPAALAPEPMPVRPRLLPLAGVERKMMRELSRGNRTPEARLDLHGMRQAEAHEALIGFLYRHHALGSKLVLVITGKGGTADALGGERGILRRLVPHWLADPGLRRIVVGYDESARHHGGEGALYVRLRRRREA